MAVKTKSLIWAAIILSTALILVGTGINDGAAFGVIGGLLASTTFFLARGFGLVILRDALNKRVPSEFRATANSLASFGFRGAFVLTGPVVGYAYDLWGMGTTLALLVGVTLVIFVTLIVPLIVAVRAVPAAQSLEIAEN